MPSLDTFAALSMGALAVIVALVMLVALRRRGEKCASCGARWPRGAVHCPKCGIERLQRGQASIAARPKGTMDSTADLVATDGPLASQRFPIPSQGLSVGRHPDNDVVLSDEFMVSRYHAVINLEQGKYILYDKDSANGTWVNEQRIFRHTLAPGDRIQIWRSQFVFTAAGTPLGAVPSPPPTPVVAAPVIQTVGEYFDGYYLDGLIGRGGMSEVYRARDPDGTVVAIKILQERNPYLVEKFRQEGNRIGPLLGSHPNIVYVHKFSSSQDGRLYIVMEFVDAPSLRKVMQRQLSESEIVEIIGQVCSALAFAHQNNIVHRDIKPENILVTGEGKAKVLDFGIAKLTSAATVTRDKIVGTPEYISPEQAQGDRVRPASDVYSLGVVLYEILAGSVPFRRPRLEDAQKAAMEVIRQHLRERPEPVSKRSPYAQVPRQLETVTMRALEKNVKDRYKTAREMGEALGYREMSLVPASPPRQPGEASLLILHGPRRGQRIRLANHSLTLGRIDLDSTNTAISRQHVSIIYRGGGYWLQDMSKNGTWVNDQRVYGEVPLATGALIRIGDNVLALESK
jgi:serine/threonine protein kinase/ribosomal protein L40E